MNEFVNTEQANVRFDDAPSFNEDVGRMAKGFAIEQ